MRLWHPALVLGVLAGGACNFDQSTNPNSPDPIGANPTRAQIAVAANGMLIAFRTDFADFALDMGIIGREILRFDGSDPRFTTELLHKDVKMCLDEAERLGVPMQVNPAARQFLAFAISQGDGPKDNVYPIRHIEAWAGVQFGQAPESK